MKINDHLIRMGWSDLQIKKVIAIYQGLKTNMPVEAAVKRLEQRDSLTFSLSDLIKFIPDSLAKRQMADSARGFRMGDEFLRGEYIVDRYPFMKEAIVAVSSYLNYLLVPNLSDSVEYESRLVGFADQMEVHKLPNSFSTPLFYYSGQNIPNYLDRRVYYKKIREKYILVETNECLERVGNIFVDNFQLSQARAYSVFNFMREFLNPDKIDLRYALVGYGVTPQTKETKFRRKVDIIFKRCD